MFGCILQYCLNRNCCLLWLRISLNLGGPSNIDIDYTMLTVLVQMRKMAIFFFPKTISFISIKKSARGLHNVHKKVLYTKEMVKARTRGDDISISVLERRLWTEATSSIIAIIFSCSWEQPPKSLAYCHIAPAQPPISSPIIPAIYLREEELWNHIVFYNDTSIRSIM